MLLRLNALRPFCVSKRLTNGHFVRLKRIVTIYDVSFGKQSANFRDHIKLWKDWKMHWFALWQQIVRIIEIFYPDGDYHFNAEVAEHACGYLTSGYLKMKQTENPIEWLLKVCHFTIHFDTYDFESSTPRRRFAVFAAVDGSWRARRKP